MRRLLPYNPAPVRVRPCAYKLISERVVTQEPVADLRTGNIGMCLGGANFRKGANLFPVPRGAKIPIPEPPRTLPLRAYALIPIEVKFSDGCYLITLPLCAYAPVPIG